MSEKLPENKIENMDSGIEIIENLTDNALSEISTIENEVATEDFKALEDLDLKATIEKPGAITVVIKNKEKNIFGFVIALPNDEVYEELHSDDPDFISDPSRLYVYDIAIGNKNRSLANFINLTKALIKEARARNFKILSMHTRTSEGLSSILQKRYHAKKLRTLDDWQGYKEPFDYLEMEI